MWEKYYSKMVEEGLFKDVESRCLMQIYGYIFHNFGKGINKALEIGCGVGRYSGLVSRWCQISVGVDLQIPRQIQKSSTLKTALYVTADARSLPFKDESFDFVHSQGFYEHFIGKERELVFRESVRVLRKNGLLFFSVPNSMNFLYRIGKFISEVKGTWIFGVERPLMVNEALCALKRVSMRPIFVGGISFLGQIFDLPTLKKLFKNFGTDIEVFRIKFKNDWRVGMLPALLGRQFFVLAIKSPFESRAYLRKRCQQKSFTHTS